MNDIYEMLLVINIAALTAVCIHNCKTKTPKEPSAMPKIFKKKHKEKEQSREEKRNAEILDEISKYNGMEVRR